MKVQNFGILLIIALFSAGCCTLTRPLAGKADVSFWGDGPPSDSGTGSIVCVFGTYFHPRTEWYVEAPKGKVPQIHTVGQSLDNIVTGIPAGKQRIHFNSCGLATPPPPLNVEVEGSRTAILSVSYR